MLDRAAAGASEGLWLRADRQTGGKGRQGRRWVSRPGNLHISTLVRLRLGDPPAPTLALVAAVALHQVLCAFSSRVQIKWPNDLICFPDQVRVQNDGVSGSSSSPEKGGGAKLAGILLERAGDAVVIGFGVNLAHHPDDLDRPVTSIFALANVAPPPDSVAEELARTFSAWLSRWRQGGLDPVRAAWLAAAHPFGTRLNTPAGKGSFEGLEATGALRLRLDNGGIRIVHAGDVFLL